MQLIVSVILWNISLYLFEKKKKKCKWTIVYYVYCIQQNTKAIFEKKVPEEEVEEDANTCIFYRNKEAIIILNTYLK